MPAAYTHLVMVSLLVNAKTLAAIGACERQEVGELLKRVKFFELGAVSPDYPYLHLLTPSKNESSHWADIMHYAHVGDRIRAGIRCVCDLNGPEKYKALAWLLGFVSHVITDVTIHPIVELKVGPYEENKRSHRVCEMNQDVYIHRRLKVGEVNRHHLETGIGSCVDANDPDKMDSVIRILWSKILEETTPEQFAQSQPEIDSWHRAFLYMMRVTAPQSGLFCWSRHLLSGTGLVYPLDAAPEYINALRIPDGRKMHYDMIFDKAKENVKVHWDIVLRACLGRGDVDLSKFKNWNLDTGKDEHGVLTFWED